MLSKAITVEQYLAELPADRREALGAVRTVILKNLDKDYEEGMQYGMIGYYVPHRVFPAGYHCDPTQPLCYAGLSSQKNHMSLYLMCVYGDGDHAKWFREQWAKTGKKLDMGKSCIRFKKLNDLALDVIGETIKRVPAKKYIARYVSLLDSRSERVPKKAGGSKTKVIAAKKAKAAKPAKRAKAARKGK